MKVTLKIKWEMRLKLHAEGAKLRAEGDLIWIEAWISVHGKDSVVNWDYKS